MKSRKKVRARAPAPGVPVLVRLQPDELKTLDEWRQRQDDLPTRAEALRRKAGLR